MRALRASIATVAAAAFISTAPVSANTTGAPQDYPANQAGDTPQARPANDMMVADRIEDRLEADAQLDSYDLDVTFANGVATLTGKVKTQAEKDRATQQARVSGVTRVDNRITISEDAGNAFVDASKEAVSVAAREAEQGAAAAGEAVTDAWITTKISADFVDEDLLDDSDIDVDTDDHVVTLTGRVASQAGRARAVDIARKTSGVTRVVDRLTVVEGAKSAAGQAADRVESAADRAGNAVERGAEKTGNVITDAWITTKIHADFVDEDLLDGSDIDVDTDGHVVTLTGTIKSEAGRARAVEIAAKTDGVTRVVDKLAVK